MSGGMKSLCFFLLLASFGLTQVAVADISWLERVVGCKEFSQALAEYFKTIADFDNLSSSQKKELIVVLDEACGERFSQCGFAVCKNLSREDPPGEQGKTNWPEWLKGDLSCDDFLREVKSRYHTPSGLKSLSVEKKSELDQVLLIACSEHFSHCKFKSCKDDTPVSAQKNSAGQKVSSNAVADGLKKEVKENVVDDKIGGEKTVQADPSQALLQAAKATDKKTKDVPNVRAEPLAAEPEKSPAKIDPQQLRAEAQAELARQVSLLRAFSREMIARAVKEEKEKNLDWPRLGNEEEMSALAERQALEDKQRADDKAPKDNEYTGYPEVKAPQGKNWKPVGPAIKGQPQRSFPRQSSPGINRPSSTSNRRSASPTILSY
jgi:hypothetical protein